MKGTPVLSEKKNCQVHVCDKRVGLVDQNTDKVFLSIENTGISSQKLAVSQ